MLYQAFSRREITISLLDARAGSPPSAGELLRRLAAGRSRPAPARFLVEWERWAAELLESHLSFPVLSYYRSQHDNQSWVGALTAILDTSRAADRRRGRGGRLPGPADVRHGPARGGGPGAGVPDAAAAAGAGPAAGGRPGPAARVAARGRGGAARRAGGGAVALAELRGLYEPFVNALAAYFLFALPPFQPETPPVDNWQTSPWMPRSPGLGGLPGAAAADEHFD